MATTSPVKPSKNPFLNPPNSNNPFLRPTLTGNGPSASSASPQLSVAPPFVQRPLAITPATHDPFLLATSIPIPETPATSQPGAPELFMGNRPSSVPLPPSSSSSEPVRNPPGLSEDEALAAAIAASLSESHPPSSGSPPSHPPPPGPPPSHLPPPGPPPSRSTPSLALADSLPPVPDYSSGPSASFEEPPAYTPSADSQFGETTVEFGPRRPFQNDARPSGPPGPRFIAPQSTGGGGGWGQYTSYISRQATGTNVDTPPRLPPRGPSTSDGGNGNSSSQAPPGGFAPPPGPPPGASRSGTTTRRAEGRARPSLASASTNAPDDGTPTTAPTPGRPLLRNGKTLVYPAGHMCYKCNNTGYRSYDPSHPCSKCWPRYARPYQGPLTYAPWSNRDANTNYQRPLPKTLGPPAAARSPVNQASSSSRSSWGSPGDTYDGYPGSISRASSNAAFVRGAPPPGSLVVLPGDPRIGGRICWNCGGDGVVSFFIFDSERCPTCNGMGRIL